jgi:hypothetical protein
MLCTLVGTRVGRGSHLKGREDEETQGAVRVRARGHNLLRSARPEIRYHKIW